MSGSLPWDTGYSLLFLSGLFVWVGVPVLNSKFGTSIMTSHQIVPVIGIHQMNVVLGGGLLAFGLISYMGFRYG